MSLLSDAATRPARAILWLGLMLAGLLAVGLGLMLVNDHQRRLEAAQRQSMALATGSQRLLRLELRNLERAMLGIAADASQLFEHVPEQAPHMLNESVAGVLGRHGELESIVVVDHEGRALTAGRGDPQLMQWAQPSARGSGSFLYVGPPERLGDGSWVVRLALRMQADRWILTRLRTSELQAVISGLDTGRDGVVSITNGQGYVLARSPDASGIVGQQFPLRNRNHIGTRLVTPLGTETSAVDGMERVSTMTTLSEYPLVVFAGLGRREILAPWWPYAQAAVGIYLVYWIGFLVLWLSARRSERNQRKLTEEVLTGHAELMLAHQVGRVGTWFIEEEGRIVRWSPLAREMFGLDVDRVPVEAYMQRVHHDDVARVRESFRAMMAKDGVMNEVYRVLLPGGAWRWISARGQRVDAGHEQPVMIGAVTDVTEWVEAQARVQEAERQFRLVFDRNPAPFWVFDRQSLYFLEVNQAAIDQYGFSREEFLSMTILQIRPTEDWEGIRDAISSRDGNSGQGRDAVVRIHQRKDGSLIEVRAHLSTLIFNGVEACLVLAEDVSERMAYERQLAYHATHNVATGLLNPRALMAELDADESGYTIAYVQMRGLQLVSDTLGREAGESVLRAVSTRLGGLGARYGLLAFQPSEDFVFAIRGEHPRQLALDALLAAVSEPIRGNDSHHQLEPRVGVAVKYDGDDLRAEQVVGMAAQAAHAARDEGSVISWFDATAAARLSERLRLAGRIHNAIDQEFELYFQPICHAADGGPVALEALLRWPQADGSFIPPGEFIQLCEDTGLILALGRWVIRAAARAQAQLVQAGWAHLPIAVNVSAVQFFNSDLVAEFGRASEEFGLARGALQVELTESSLMRKPALAKQTMQRLHEQGICISLDDFGTGFSSMSYLQHLPLDVLKIDRSFVTDVETNPRNASICRALLTLGHSMGLTVIAEGVETPGQYAWLAAHGCDQVQGYLLGRPMPLARVIEQLQMEAV